MSGVKRAIEEEMTDLLKRFNINESTLTQEEHEACFAFAQLVLNSKGRNEAAETFYVEWLRHFGSAL